nr:tetratricopeptide repeat protein [Nocardia bovistercoris]
MVRPGTWEGLRGHLNAVRAERGSGWYHLVHFDVHGAFTDPAAVRAGGRAGGLPSAAGDPTTSRGKEGYLFFETDVTGRSDPRSADEVAKLLGAHGVPMAVVNACQSAMQDGSEAALAQRLAETGVPLVVGMAYAVTVAAAALAMPALYGQLVRGVEPEEALRQMRRRLFESPDRQGFFDQILPLHDWVLPVVFRQHRVDLGLREMRPGEADSYEARASKVGAEPTPEYGFVGRDLDVHGIERMLLTDPDRNQILVRGMAGAGKSTLLAHLGWWWQRTGLVDEVFTFSYEDRAWTADQVVRAIAARLWPDRTANATWESSSEEAKRELVARTLRAQRHLLVIDNMESVTGAPASIPHALPAGDREALRELLARLRGGRTLVALGSREAETWLAAESFGACVHELGGLDPQAASVLADRILNRHNAVGYLDDPDHREALTALLESLGGYPLPMEVVLPTLSSTTPARVLEELGSGGPGADPTGSLRAAIEYSYAALDHAVQRALALLAPFTAVIPGADLLAEYQRLLQEYEPDDDRWGALDVVAGVEAAVRIGVAARHENLSGWVRVVPVLPYFLRRTVRAHPGWWQAARRAHYRLHVLLGERLLSQMIGLDPASRASGHATVQACYANFTDAMDTALEHGFPVTPVLWPIEVLLDQTRQYTAREHLLLGAATALSSHTGAVARNELARLLHQLGWVAHDQRRFDEAEGHYRRALELLLELGDRRTAGRTYHQLGLVCHDLRRFDEAERHYKQAVEVWLEFGSRHAAARTYHQLGVAAHARERLEQAEDYYRQSLELKLEFGDRPGAAVTYHQLGKLARDQRRLEQAEEHFLQSLGLKLEFGDRRGAASTYHQLGMIAHDRSHFEQAQDYYRQALELKLEFGDRHAAALTYHQLGSAAQDQRRFEQAEDYFRRALELKLEFGDRHGAASTYYHLGMVAEQQRRPDQAENHYRRALQAFPVEDGERGPVHAATALGRLLIEIGRRSDAFTVLVEAAAGWWRITGGFDFPGIDALAEQYRHLDQRTTDDVIDALAPTVATALRQRLAPRV